MADTMHAVNMLALIKDQPDAKHVPFIDISSCVDWWAAYDSQAHGLLYLNRYPCVRLPFRAAILHSPAPRKILLENGQWEAVPGADHVSEAYYAFQDDRLHLQRIIIIDGSVVPTWSVVLALHEDGRIDSDTSAEIRYYEALVNAAKESGDREKSLLDTVLTEMHPALFAISLMHAKNVKVETASTPIPRNIRRHQHVPEVSWKTLEIGTMKQHAKSQTKPGGNSILQALHLCRGSYATYTEENKAFGRLTGTFWRPAHVKGNRAAGEVKKTYVVITEE